MLSLAFFLAGDGCLVDAFDLLESLSKTLNSISLVWIYFTR
jgi:hypothetical protein